MNTSLKNMSTMDQSDQSNQTNGYDQTYKSDVLLGINQNLIQIKIDEYPSQENTKRNIIPKKLKDYEEYYDLSSLGGFKKRQKIKEPKSYECQFEDCKKLFHDKGAFRKHQLTHGEKQYICPDCNKKFLDNSKLRRHSLVHSGDKPFRCNICQKRFSLDFNLRTHLRIHTGEKPYACIHPGCFKRFSQSSNLTAHEKIHELPRQGGQFNPNNSNGVGVSIQFMPFQQPIFTQNPLKNLMNNCFSGSLTINNLMQVNRLYELMKEGIIQQSMSMSHNANDTNPSGNSSNNNCGNNSLNYNYYQERNTNCNTRYGSTMKNESNNFFKISNPNNSNNTATNQGGSNSKKLFVTNKEKKIFEIRKDDFVFNQSNSNNNYSYNNNNSHYENNQRRDVTIVYESNYRNNNIISNSNINDCYNIINEEAKHEEYSNYIRNNNNNQHFHSNIIHQQDQDLDNQRVEIDQIEGEEIVQVEGEENNGEEADEDGEKEDGYFAYRSWEQSFK